MDIAKLAERTGISSRLFRYVFDQQILPGAQDVGRGRGVPRSLTAFEAFSVALAALLLDANFKRSLVVACLTEIMGKYPRSTPIDDIPLYKAFVAEGAWLEIGDGRFVRVHGQSATPLTQTFDTGWQTLNLGVLVPSQYAPLVLVRIDLATLRIRVGKDD